MKTRFLHLFVAVVSMFMGTTMAVAGNWEEPKLPQGKAPADGDKVMLYNVEEGLFLKSGKVTAKWESSTILGEAGLMFTLEQNSNPDDPYWLIKTSSGGYSGKYVFAPTADGDYPHCFVDMGGTWQGCHMWNIDVTPDGAYRISTVPTHSMSIEGTYFGTDGETLDVYFNINPDENENAHIDWLFITEEAAEAYQVRLQLYEALNTAESEFPTLSLTEASNVFNNSASTLAELKKALNELKSAMAADIFDKDASVDNPQDVTWDLLKNPTFDTDVDGWDIVGGFGWRGPDPDHPEYSHRENGDIIMDLFCEKWVWNSAFGQTVSMSQTLNLPKGLYRFSADCIAVRQGSSTPVKGIKLYAKTNTEFSVPVATQDYTPTHYSVNFIVDGSTATEVGLYCDASTLASWVAVDNYTLEYLGQTEVSENYFILDNTFKMVDEKYGEEGILEVNALQSVIDDYAKAYDEAKAALEGYTLDDAGYAALNEKLSSAYDALVASQKEYQKVENIINNKIPALTDRIYEIDETMAEQLDELNEELIDGVTGHAWTTADIEAAMAKYQARENYVALIEYTIEKTVSDYDSELIDQIENFYNELLNDWASDKYETVAAVAAARQALDDMIQDFLASRLEPGQDITSMILTPTFENKNFDGWTLEYGDIKYADNVAEVYQLAFDFHQTLKNLPKGRYTLTVQAFQRTGYGSQNYNGGDGSAINAYLYGNNSSVKLHHVCDYPTTEDDQYASGNDSHDDGIGYYPNSTGGANNAFSRFDEDDVPLYTNTLDIFLTEAAKNDLTIGIRGGKTDGGWWTLFNNFQLVYQGNNAEDYADGIQQLMEELEEIVGEVTLTVKTQDLTDTALGKGQAAIDGGTADECIQAVNALEDAIEKAKATVAAMNQLVTDYGYYSDFSGEVVSGDSKFMELLDATTNALTVPTYADDAAIEQARKDLRNAFTAYVQYDGLNSATEENPHDMSPVIMTRDYIDYMAGEGESMYSTKGWNDQCEGSHGINENGCEYYQKSTFRLSQTIYNLAPGYYKLHVNGYYRPGWPGQNMDGSLDKVHLFAGAEQTRLLSIYSDSLEDQEAGTDWSKINMNGAESEEDAEYKYVPNSMTAAAWCFSDDMYRNTLVFQVEGENKDVEIGVYKNENSLNGDWVMLGPWSLEYVGTSAPAEESTAVKSIAFGEVKDVIFFNANGQQLSRLAKGINIVKRIDANGNVRVTKVLVK